jgi:phenylalanyl-tRNA synthetase beta chain
MLFSRRWLADYVELPADVAELARRLTLGGFNVERVERVEPVAGAAEPPAPGSAASSASVAASGASASAAASSASAAVASVAADQVLDVEITSNRPDCMCHLGLARELAVLLDRRLAPPDPRLAEDPEPASGAARVEVEDPAGCPAFVARVIAGVRIGPSPDWLRRRLEAIGVRAINNVVDATNFVLWELGQPLHAYDLARLAGRRLVVRRARGGERLRTLDGVLRELDAETLVIADGERPVGLAGIMGGLDSEVTADTTDLLLEAAHFDRRTVRTAARRLGLHTDASHRFERGTDPAGCESAAARAAALIAELAGGRVLSGALVRRAAPVPVLRGRLELARLVRFAGAPVSAAEVARILSGLGFLLAPATAASGPAWEVTVPSWRLYDFDPRPDGTVYEADLFEEVLRIVGFDRIPAALPALPGSDGGRTPLQRARDRTRRCLAAAGYHEAINFSFLDSQADAAFPSLRPDAAPLELANPLSERYSVLRRSLVPNLVESARLNRRRGAPAVRLFEIASVFFDAPGAPLPDQPEHVALVAGGHLGSPWDRELDLDFFDLKGAVEGLAEELGVRLAAKPADLPGLLAGNAALLHLAGRSAAVGRAGDHAGAGGEHDAAGGHGKAKADNRGAAAPAGGPDGAGEVVGYLGRVDREEGFPLFVAELSLSALVARATLAETEDLRVEIPSRHPSVSADLTLTHRHEVPWAEIEAAIAAAPPPDLVSFRLKDRYAGPGVPEGAVNTTITFLYNARDRSLTQEEVNARQLALAAELDRRFGWRS